MKKTHASKRFYFRKGEHSLHHLIIAKKLGFYALCPLCRSELIVINLRDEALIKNLPRGVHCPTDSDHIELSPINFANSPALPLTKQTLVTDQGSFYTEYSEYEGVITGTFVYWTSEHEDLFRLFFEDLNSTSNEGFQTEVIKVFKKRFSEGNIIAK